MTSPISISHMSINWEETEAKLASQGWTIRSVHSYHTEWDPPSNCCETCGSPNADYIPNPYVQDIQGFISEEWMCTDCYNNAVSDI